MKKKLLTIGLAALAVVGLCGCSKKEEETTPVEEPTVEVEDKTDVEPEVEKEAEEASWQESDTLEDAVAAAGVEAEFGDLEGYKVVGYYYVEGGVAAVYSDEESHLIEVRKADVAHVESAMGDLGDSEDYTSGDVTVGETLVSTFADTDGVKLLIWTDATSEGSDVELNYEYSVWSVDNVIAEADFETLVGVVK